MRPQDRILEVIRAHPEGITTPEISQIIYPGKNSYAQVYNKARMLEVYGFISRSLEPRKNKGKTLETAVWKPLQGGE